MAEHGLQLKTKLVTQPTLCPVCIVVVTTPPQAAARQSHTVSAYLLRGESRRLHSLLCVDCLGMSFLLLASCKSMVKTTALVLKL